MSAQTVSGTDVQQNFLSCSNGQWGLCDGTPQQKNLDAMPDLSGAFLLPLNPKRFDAIFKISDGTTGLTLDGLRVAQGAEDSLNVSCRCSGLRLGGLFGIGEPGLRCITLKGGLSNVMFLDGTRLMSRGTQCDIKVGDWMDQTYDACTILDVSRIVHDDGKPIVIACNHRDQLGVGPNQQVKFWYSTGLTAYWYFKWAARKVARIPVGKPGPSFLS